MRARERKRGETAEQDEVNGEEMKGTDKAAAQKTQGDEERRGGKSGGRNRSCGMGRDEERTTEKEEGQCKGGRESRRERD